LRFPLWAQINHGRHAVGGNTSAEMEAIADLRFLHTGSQQIGTIDTNATMSTIEVDFAEPGMRIPIHQGPRRVRRHYFAFRCRYCSLSYRIKSQTGLSSGMMRAVRD
jgi:hypothetical protein